MPNEVFLSHTSADRVFVDRLVSVLTLHGVPVWYSKTNILGAQQWHDEIGAALQRCDWMALVLSPDSIESTWVKRELLFALQERQYDERIVPVVWRSCEIGELSWTLSQMQMVDFNEDFDDGCRQLLQVWGIGYDPNKTP